MDKKKVKEAPKPTNQKVREFKVGDLAVYPAHCVGRINSI